MVWKGRRILKRKIGSRTSGDSVEESVDRDG